MNDWLPDLATARKDMNEARARYKRLRTPMNYINLHVLCCHTLHALQARGRLLELPAVGYSLDSLL